MAKEVHQLPFYLGFYPFIIVFLIPFSLSFPVIARLQ